MDERWCYETLRVRRWPEGVRCPRCGAGRVTVHTRSARAPRRRYLCLACRRTFNDLTGTVFARSILPLPTWFRGLSLLGDGLATTEYARALSLKWDTASRMSRLLLAASGRPGLVQELLTALAHRTTRRAG